MRAALSPIGGAQTESWRHMFGEPESTSPCSPCERAPGGSGHKQSSNQTQNRPPVNAGGAGKTGWFVPPLALGSTAEARCGDLSRTHDSNRAHSSARSSHTREPLRRRSLSDGDGDGVEDR
jgi:hypothetical protein